MLNKICELSAEIGKATLILESKDEQIKSMHEHIENQEKTINEMQAQMRNMQAQIQQAKSGKDDPAKAAKAPQTLEGRNK